MATMLNPNAIPDGSITLDKIDAAVLATKQDTISDLNTIRSGAAKGATALQSYTETDPVYLADKPNIALKSELNGKVDKEEGKGLSSNDYTDEEKAKLTELGDRAADETQMGYIVLRKGVPFAEQVTQANTIYEIRYDFDLDGASVTIPAGCVLKFNGGKITDGTLVGHNTYIEAVNVCIFSNITITGSWNNHSAYIEWYGTYANAPTSVSVGVSINALVGICNRIKFGIGIYYAHGGDSINLPSFVKLIGACRGRSYNGYKNTCIEFLTVPSSKRCVTIGTPSGINTERERNISISDISFLLAKEDGVTESSVLTIGAVSNLQIDNCVFYNNNTKQTEYEDEDENSAIQNSNYGIVIDGHSEFVKLTNCSSTADIPVLTESNQPLDFISFDKCTFDSGEYGYAGMCGAAMFCNTSLIRCSFNRGLYGIKWKRHPSLDVESGVFKILDSRIEQLRNKSFSTNIFFDLGDFAWNKKKPVICLDSVVFFWSNRIEVYWRNGCGYYFDFLCRKEPQ